MLHTDSDCEESGGLFKTKKLQSSFVSFPGPYRVAAREGKQIPIKNQSPEGFPSGLSGAATRIWTGDLVLTKDALYQLSHSSMHQDFSQWLDYYNKFF